MSADLVQTLCALPHRITGLMTPTDTPDRGRRRLLLGLAGLPLLALGESALAAQPRQAARPAPKPAARTAPAPRPRTVTKSAPEAARRQAAAPARPALPLPALNTRVQQRLTELRARGLLGRNEASAWLVQELRSGQQLLAINSTAALQAASMIKPFVAAAFLSQVQAGRHAYTPQRRVQMEAMIVHSDNDATNALMRLVGGPTQVQAELRRLAPDVFRQTAVLEYIPAGGRTYRNRASAQDYARFLAALWARRLPHSDELLRVMAIPNRDRLYDGAEGVTRGTAVYDKTGTTARLCGDMGILVARCRDGRQLPYAIVGIVQSPVSVKNYGNWMLARGNVIREISSVVYQELRKTHGLV